MSILWAFFVFTKVKSFKNSYRLTLTTSIIAFGIIIEYLQLYLTDYRSFDWWDVLANSVGVFLGITAFSLFIKRIYR
jgi:VanZ family protein